MRVDTPVQNKSVLNKATPSLRNLSEFGLWALLLITIISVFVPFSPIMPVEEIDHSWTLGINQAVAQGLAFGRDIIWNYGPYASILTREYHPATDSLMLAGA